MIIERENFMREEYQLVQKKEILRFALFLGELMLTNGVETSRAEDSVLRVCASRGYHHINAYTSPTCIIIADDKFDGLSFMRTIKRRGIDLNKIDLLNNLSRKFVENPDMTTSEAIKELKRISSLPAPYNIIPFYAATGLASACFAYLIGGTTVADFLLTLIISVIGTIIYDGILKINYLTFISTLISSFAIATFGITFCQIGILQDPKMLIVGSIMPLLPGVAFVKGLRDLISGDLVSGISRVFEAFLIAAAIAIGVGSVLDFWIKFGG